MLSQYLLSSELKLHETARLKRRLIVVSDSGVGGKTVDPANADSPTTGSDGPERNILRWQDLKLWKDTF